MRLLLTSSKPLQLRGLFNLSSVLSSLRLRLILLVLIALVPAFGLTLYTNLEARQHATVEVQQDAMRLTRLASNSQGQLMEGTHQLLFVLAQLWRVQPREDKESCNALMADLLKRYPAYANLGIVELNGNVRCSGVPFTQPVNQADRRWFQRAIQTGEFSAGDYQIGRISGKASIHFAYPVRDKAGNLTGVVYAALDLAFLNQLATTVQLPKGSTFIVLDQQGTILARYPESERWVGKSALEVPLVKTILKQHQEGKTQTWGLDGKERLYAFTPLSGTPKGSKIYVSVGIPTTVAYAKADQLLTRNLTGLALTAWLAILAALIGSELFVLRQVRALLKATKQLSAGNLSTRTGLPHGSRELNQLASAFNIMAESLESTLKERDAIFASLRQREKKYRSVVNSIREVIFQTDETGCWTLLNPAWTQITGFGIGESIGTPLLNYVHPDDRSRIGEMTHKPATIRKSLEANGKGHKTADNNNLWYRYEVRYLTKDGSYRWMEMQTQLNLSADGTLRGTSGTLNDITERKSAEEALRKAHEELEIRVRERTAELRDLYNSAPCGYHSLAEDGTFVFINDTELSWLGYTREEVVGKKKFSDFLTPESLEVFKINFPRLKDRGWVRDLEFQLIRKDGSILPVLLNSTAVKDENGAYLMSRSSLFDITERKAAEAQIRTLNAELEQRVIERTAQLEAANQLKDDLLIREQAARESAEASEQRYRFLTEVMPQIVWTAEPNGLVTYYNQRWFDYTGMTLEETQGWGWKPVLHPEDLQKCLDCWKHALETGETYEVECRFRRASDGQYRWHLNRALPVRDATGQIIEWVGTCTDITERKQAEREIRLLLTMTQAMSEAPDFPSTLGVALEKVCEATGWNFGEAWVPRTDRSALELCPAWYASTPKLEKFRQQSAGLTFEPNIGLPGRVWLSQQPEWMQEISTQPEDLFLRVQLAVENGLQGGVGIPIIAHGQVLAVLVFFMVESGAENKRLVELVSAVAMQLGSVIQRKQMEEALDKLIVQLQQKTEDLSALTTVTANAISTLNLEELLNVLLRRIVQVTRADTAVILLKEKDHLRVAKSVGLHGGVATNYQFALNEGFAGIIASTMQPLYIEDAQQDPRVLPFRKQLGTRTILGVPLKRHGKLIGVLHVDWFSVHPQSEREIHLLEITAERCAMAILNAQLYEELREREELYCTLTKNFPNGVVLLFDHDLRYALAEGKGLTNWGLSKECLEGKTIWEVFPPKICEELEPKYRAALAGEATAFETTYTGRCYLVHTLPVRNDQGEIFAGMVMAQDITDRKRAEEQMRYYAFHDSLTELPNRAWFLEKLSQILEQVEQNPEHLCAVLFLDLDRFQIVKYSLGHLVADQLLISTACKLRDCLGPSDIMARVGSDEFAILLPDIQNVNDAIQVSERIHQQLTLPFELDGHEVFSTTSIGIALSSTEYDRPENFLRAADTAMHQAKRMGKARHAVFDPATRQWAVAHLQLETDLRRALKRQEFHLFYQPIVSLKSGRLKGFEALVRWQHPRRGRISPAEFIPLAEETGLIVPLGAWVLREACQQMRVWQQKFPEQTAELTMSVNLSGIQFAQSGLIEQIDQILEETDIDPSCLKLEITESVIMENAESAKAVLEQLKARNILLCIDDFGTGYSSLSYLHRWPMDTLKIDRSFVNGLPFEPHSREIIWTIVTLANNLGMEVVAEGVETDQQLIQLQTLKRECHYGQGYFFSKPVDSTAAASLIASGQRW